jgi:LPXTG-motif cell wall-anchored protein
MGRQLGALMFAGAMGLGAVAASGRTIEDARPAEPTTTVAVQRVSVPATGMRDEAAMVLVGSALIGLAALLRRTA